MWVSSISPPNLSLIGQLTMVIRNHWKQRQSHTQIDTHKHTLTESDTLPNSDTVRSFLLGCFQFIVIFLVVAMPIDRPTSRLCGQGKCIPKGQRVQTSVSITEDNCQEQLAYHVTMEIFQVFFFWTE